MQIANYRFLFACWFKAIDHFVIETGFFAVNKVNTVKHVVCSFVKQVLMVKRKKIRCHSRVIPYQKKRQGGFFFITLDKSMKNYPGACTFHVPLAS